MKPIVDRVLIKQDPKKEQTKGGIILAGSAQQESPRGRVVATGPGKYENGELVPMYVKEGDYVVFNVNYNQKVFHNGEEYVILNESDVLMIIDPEDEVSGQGVVEGVGVQVNGSKHA